MTEILNRPQRGSLAIALRMFEEELRRADAWLQSKPEEGTLYRQALRITPETRALAQHKIAAALAQIAEVAEEFDLEQQEQDLAATIAAAMSLSWATLCDARSTKLRRYGSIDPSVGDILDPRIDRLAELALSLASVLRTR